MKKELNEIKKSLPFLLPSLAGVSVFVLLPSADVVRRSVTTVITGEFVGLENFRRVFSNRAFLMAAGNTVRFVAVCLPLLIGLSLLIALLLRKVRHIQLLKTAYLLPMAVPAAAAVLIWNMLFDERGIVNGWLLALGRESVSFMDTGAAFYILVLSYLWKNIGYTVILWLAGLAAIPVSMVEAARVDGAGELRCFFQIVFPNLRPALYTITVLSFLNSFKVFREAYLVAGAYPHDSMYMLQHLFNNWFLDLDLDKMAAAAVCMGAVLLCFILLLQYLWDKKGDSK